jgi:NAD(P)-dependent dehydrogenase (short-subunit alcohol dehydrogenase family)
VPEFFRLTLTLASKRRSLVRTGFERVVETGALIEMMGLSPEQAEAIKEHERKLIPLGRRGTPEEVARRIDSLANSAVDWVTGKIIAVDGGRGLA